MILYPADVNNLEEAFHYLGAAEETPPNNEAPLTFSHLQSIMQYLEPWPTSSRLPCTFLTLIIS